MKADRESVESMAAPRLGGLAAWVALAAVLMAVIAAASVSAPSDGVESGTCGYALAWDLDDEGVLTIDGFGCMYNYSACGPWGAGIKKVIAVNGLRSVGDHAFEGCSSLVSVDMPLAGSVGDHAFEGCSSLVSVDMPSAITIGRYAFDGCDGLCEVLIPASVVSIGEDAFEGYTFTSLDGSELDHDAESLSGHVYLGSGDMRLERVDGEGSCGDYLRWEVGLDGVLRITGSGNMKDYSLSDPAPWSVLVKGVFVGDGVKSIGDYAFSGCTRLVFADMSSVGSVGDYAFSGCDDLREVLIPRSVFDIGSGAFGSISFLDPDGNALAHDAKSLCDHLYLGDGNGVLKRSERDGTCGGRLYWSLDANGVLTIAGDGEMEEYGDVGPWGVGVKMVLAGDGVRSVGNHAFYNCSSLVSVDMPSVESVSDNAFQDCSSLVSVDMPLAGSLGYDAFRGCSSLMSVSMPAIETIYEYAYVGCFNIRFVSMPVAVSIGAHAFPDISDLREVLIPASLESIGEGAFAGITFLDLDGSEIDQNAEALRGHIYVKTENNKLIRADGEGTCGEGLSWVVGFDRVLRIDGEGYMDDYAEVGRGPWGAGIKDVVAGEGVRSVGMLAFRGCELLMSASFPGAESIGDSAFNKCMSLQSVSMPAAMSVGMRAFYDCYNLESVDMPSATSIGYRAFEGCVSLQSVSMPAAVSIGERAFQYCGSLERVCLPWTLASLGNQAFDGKTFLDEGGRTLSQNAESLRGYAYEGAGDGKLKRLPFAQDGVGYQVYGEGLAVAVGWYGEPSGLRIPDEVQYNGKGYVPAAIADGAFAGCGTLETITIGSSVASIGEGALDAPMLRSIEVSSGNAAYSSVAGVLYDRDGTVLIKFPSSKQRLVIPGTVTEIAPRAFESAGAALKAEQGSGDVSYLRYVSVPGSVVSIGEGAFRGSTLEVLKLADGTTAIGAEAFSGCASLAYVVFCDTLEEVGDGAFDGCVFRDGGTEMALDDALAGHKFTGEDAAHLGLYVPKPGGTIVSGDVKYRITDSGESKALSAVRPAGEDAAELSIPATVRYLGFDWEVTSVASKAFSGLQSLRSVSFGGSVSVGPYAFFGCRSLGSVTFGGEAALGTSAFSGCSSLADADLSRVAAVGKHAFYGCALTRADLSSAEAVGYGAFTGNDLREVAFSPGLKSVDPKAFFRYSFYGADGAKLPVSALSLAGKAFEGSGKVLAQTS